MSDLIDRQAALDALWKALYEYEDKTEKQFQESEDLDVGDWIEHRIFVQNMNDIDRQTILNLPSAQPVATDTNVGDKISKFIDGLEETFAYIREREGGDSVCGLCEYDGVYIGESGDWCNECPRFDRDDCFKLSDKARRGWAEEIIKALPTIQQELTDEQAIAHLQSSGWMQRHDKEMYESGLREQLADDSDSYDSLLPNVQSDLIEKIQVGITATNSNDAYSLGMRNGMRWCRSLIDGVEPKFEGMEEATT